MKSGPEFDSPQEAVGQAGAVDPTARLNLRVDLAESVNLIPDL